MTDEKICALCQRPYFGMGNSAAPFDGRCCDDCDDVYVVPTRIMGNRPAVVELITMFAKLGAQQRHMRKRVEEDEEFAHLRRDFMAKQKGPRDEA